MDSLTERLFSTESQLKESFSYKVLKKEKKRKEKRERKIRIKLKINYLVRRK